MPRRGYVAFDLGAESGRAMLATLDGGRLELTEVHRFANLPQRLPSGYHWNLLELWANLVECLRQCGAAARQQNVELVSVGVDTWGVDFGLVGKSGQLLGLPFAYRDERNPPAMRRAFDKVGEKAIYDATGIQFMPFNSLFQLIAQQQAEPTVVEQAHRLLFMPDLLHYFFCGELANEASIASTSQMIDPTGSSATGRWATGLLEKLGLPTHMLGRIVPAGTKLGVLREQVQSDAGVGALSVIAPASHDTASAIAAVPVDPELVASGRWAYISSGTWSLLGAELRKPIITDASRSANLTHERGVEGTFRYLRNIAGLWLVQEVRRDFARRGKEYSYTQLTDMAAKAQPFRTLVDPAHEPFASPGDMPAKIGAFAQKTNQPTPADVGDYVRCCLESLALAYQYKLAEIEKLVGHEIDVLHIVGGGGRNELLNQMTADAIGKPVVVGPYEATAAGNALTQAIGAGDVRDLAQLRQIVRDSFDPKRLEPRNTRGFEEQRERFLDLIAR